MMLVTSNHEGSVIYPMVAVVVDGIKCRTLLGTGTGSSYASAALVERLNKRPTHIEHRQIEMMLCSTIALLNESTKLYSESCECRWKV